MTLEKNRKIRFILFAVVLLAVLCASFLIGRYAMTARELFGALSGNGDTNTVSVLFNIRLPRVLLACMVGAALSAAGASYQGVFQNAMASPDILGASSGAAFGAALAIILNASKLWVTVSAFIFSMITVFLSWFISERGRGKKILLLVLAGIIVSSLFNAGTSYLKLVADPENQLQEITYWLMGSLNGTKKIHLLIAGIPMLIGFVPLFCVRWKINLLTLGDDEARTLGVNASRTRMLVICCATLLTAAAVSVSGMIGWVGLVIPHLCRRLVGNNYKYLIPASVLVGASFLLIVDDVARNISQTEVPIGILTAFIGAPFFMFLLISKGENV